MPPGSLKIVERINDCLADNNLHLWIHVPPSEFLCHLIPLDHEVVIGFKQKLVSVGSADRLRIVAPQIPSSFDLADSVLSCYGLCQLVEENVLMQSQSVVETDIVVNQPLPPENLPMNEDYVP